MTVDPAKAHGLLDLLDTGVVRLDPSGRILLLYIGEVADIPGPLRDAILQLPQETQSLRLHELRMGEGTYDCTLQRTGGQDVLLEFHNLEWERLRLRLQQREVQTGMLELLSRNLGHEVRNPLGGIRGAAQMLAAELEPGELATLVWPALAAKRTTAEEAR